MFQTIVVWTSQQHLNCFGFCSWFVFIARLPLQQLILFLWTRLPRKALVKYSPPYNGLDFLLLRSCFHWLNKKGKDKKCLAGQSASTINKMSQLAQRLSQELTRPHHT
jgi:hypothetical protein